MKKILSVLLAVAMLMGLLVACGGGGSDEPPAGGDNPPATNSEQPSGGDEPSGGDQPSATIDPLTIYFSSTYQETETGGVVVQHFIDKVSELSGGAITVDIAWGGTLYDSMGELDAVSQGAVDMIALGHMPHLNVLPLLSFPGFGPESSANALAYFDEIMFNNPETSALIAAEAERANIKYLNVIAGGANAFCASFEFDTLDELVAGSQSFGNFDAPAFEALGLTVSAVMPPDTYDALDRGIIDATQMALSPMVAMSWYEPAPYFMLDATYTGGNFFTVNLDWWNGLTDAQRECIQAAADATQDYSVTMFDTAIEDDSAVIVANGGSVKTLNDEDAAKWWGAMFDAKAADAMNRAAENGIEAEMTAVLKVAAEFTGYDWQP